MSIKGNTYPDACNTRWVRNASWSKILENMGYVNITSNHKPKGKHEKGKPTSYKVCLEMCKKLNINPSHVKALRSHNEIYRNHGSKLDGIWEMVHDHLANTHNIECDRILEPIQKSGIMTHLRKRIQLSHIKSLVMPYLEQKKEPLKYWKMAHSGVFITVNYQTCYGLYGTPLPKDLSQALKSLDIQFLDANESVSTQLPDPVPLAKALLHGQQKAGVVYDIMNEHNPIIPIPSLI